MSQIRSSLFIAIVSLFVLAGYGFDLLGDCCEQPKQVQVESGKAAPSKQAPTQGNDCKCICHQIVSPLTTEPLRVSDGVFVIADLVAHADEFPPDAVPIGIEYPPQLA